MKDSLKLRQQLEDKVKQARSLMDQPLSDGETQESRDALVDRTIGEAESLRAKADEIDRIEARLNAIALADANPRDDWRDPTLPHNDRRNTRMGLHNYSLLRVIRGADPHEKGFRLSGLELEVHEELVKRRARSGVTTPVAGTLIPWDLEVDVRSANNVARAMGLPETRADLTSVTGAGAVLNDTLPTMIELLRNLSLMNRLGMRVLSDMNGNFSIPRQSGASTGTWFNPRTQSFTQSGQTIDSVSFAPKMYGFQTKITRDFMYQTSADAENFVRLDQTTGMAIGLDATALAGSGSGSEPTGILYNGSVNVVSLGTNGGAPTWQKIVNMKTQLNVANALNGSLAFLTTALGEEKLKTTVKDSNTAAVYLWNENSNMVNGIPAYSTNQLPSNLTKGSGTSLSAAICGDITQAIMAFWGAPDIVVDPYSATPSLLVSTFIGADFNIRHPTCFSVIKDMVTT